MSKRIQELLDLADQEGFVLPIPAKMIIDLEDAGYVVDLRSGACVGVDTDRYSLAPAAELLCWRSLPEVEMRHV